MKYYEKNRWSFLSFFLVMVFHFSYCKYFANQFYNKKNTLPLKPTYSPDEKKKKNLKIRCSVIISFYCSLGLSVLFLLLQLFFNNTIIFIKCLVNSNFQNDWQIYIVNNISNDKKFLSLVKYTVLLYRF